MSYRDLDSFYREDPRRGRSRQSDFGVWHGAMSSLRAVWLEQTSELYALTLAGQGVGEVRVLAKLPRSGHPNRRRSDLIAEAALAGWAERSGRPGSLDWLERRLGQLRRARLEPIEWTVACPSPACPRQGEPIGPRSDAWGETCESCLGRRLVVGRDISPAQLEAKLRAGCWWLADTRAMGRGHAATRERAVRVDGASESAPHLFLHDTNPRR
jgi:hypothetical protein